MSDSGAGGYGPPPEKPGDGHGGGYGTGSGFGPGQGGYGPGQGGYGPGHQAWQDGPIPGAPAQPPALPGPGWGPGPGYGPPPPDPALVSRVHGHGVALLVLGIVAIVASCCTGLYGTLALAPAVAMTALGGAVMGEAARSPHTAQGKVRAGWICGAVWLGVLVLTIAAVVLFYGAMIGLPVFFSDELNSLSSSS